MNRLEITLGALALSAVVSCIPVPQGIPPLDYKESISDQQSQQCIDESTGSERVRLDGQANSLGPYCVSFKEKEFILKHTKSHTTIGITWVYVYIISRSESRWYS